MQLLLAWEGCRLKLIYQNALPSQKQIQIAQVNMAVMQLLMNVEPVRDLNLIAMRRDPAAVVAVWMKPPVILMIRHLLMMVPAGSPVIIAAVQMGKVQLQIVIMYAMDPQLWISAVSVMAMAGIYVMIMKMV